MPLLFLAVGVLLLTAFVWPYRTLLLNTVSLLTSYADDQKTGELDSIFEGYKPPVTEPAATVPATKPPQTSTPETTTPPATGTEPGQTVPPQTEPQTELPRTEPQTEPPPATVPNSAVTIPRQNTQYALLTYGSLNIRAPMYFGDSNKALLAGVGQYAGSCLPGYGGTILVGGHNTSWFKPLERAQVGDEITVETNYGIFTYRVTDIKILKADDKTAYDLVQRDRELLVLYTCWPFDMMTNWKPDRFFVYAEKIAGPVVTGLNG